MDLPSIGELWDFNDPAASEIRFRETMQKAEAAGNKIFSLELKTQLARTFSLRMKLDKAHEILNEVQAALPNTSTVAHIRYSLERGRAYNSNKEIQSAMTQFHNAVEYARELGELGLEIDALHMLGIAASEPEEQIRWNRVAIKKVEEATDTKVKGWLGPLYNNTAWSLNDLGKYQEARDLFERDYQYRTNLGRIEQALIAKWSMAKMDREMGDLDQALQLQLQIEQERKEADLPVGGYNHEELGEIYLEMGKADKARNHFAIAYQLLSTDAWLQKHEAERLNRMKQLSS